MDCLLYFRNYSPSESIFVRKKNKYFKGTQSIKIYVVLQYIEKINASIFLNKEPDCISGKYFIEI